MDNIDESLERYDEDVWPEDRPAQKRLTMNSPAQRVVKAVEKTIGFTTSDIIKSICKQFK